MAKKEFFLMRLELFMQGKKSGFARGKIVVFALLVAALLTGCQAAPDSVEGLAQRLQGALSTAQMAAVEGVLREVPLEKMGQVLDAIDFETLHKNSMVLSEALEQIDPRWRFDYKGFAIDYMKQVVAISGLEEAKIGEAEAPVTIIEPCKSLKDVFNLYLGQLKIDAVNPPEDVFVRKNSLEASWQYQGGSAQISSVDFVAYNIVNKRFYRVSYKGSSLTVKPMEATRFDYKDLSLTEMLREDLLVPILGLVPKDVTGPIKISFVAYRPEADEAYQGLEVALLDNKRFVLTKGDPVRETLGMATITWNPALAIPPQVGGVQTLKYLLGMPQTAEN